MVFQFLLSQGRYWWNGIRSWLFHLDYRDSGWLNSLKEQPKPGLKAGRLGPGCKFPLVSVLDNVVIKVEVRVWVWNPLKSCSCKRAKLGQPVRAGDWQLDSATRLRTTFTTSVNGSSLTHWHLHLLGPDRRHRVYQHISFLSTTGPSISNLHMLSIEEPIQILHNKPRGGNQYSVFWYEWWCRRPKL